MVRSFFKLMTINAIGLASILLLAAIIVNPAVVPSTAMLNNGALMSFKTVFISLVLEAVPFILLGVFVSACLQEFVSDRWVRRFAPRHPLLGIPFACLLGIVFPLCECGMIPVVRRLIAKGMPQYIGIVFIVVGPIVNPVVYAATYTAFRSRPDLLYARMGLALAAGAAIGLFVWLFVKRSALKVNPPAFHVVNAGEPHRHTDGGKLMNVVGHAGSEFVEMGKYLIFGCLLTAAIQTFVPRAELAGIGQDSLLSHFFMAGFAYILSLCSTSDAFVASSFLGTFSASSLLTFMVFGPMLDFKSTLMLLSVFKARFVMLLAALIVVTVLLGSMLAERFLLG